MFKWKGDKKIKALFGMQFQATQVPKLKAKALMISLVPADVGKTTARVKKAPLVEGSCTWEDPIYETVKLVREAKTGRLKEKIYYLIVASGSSKKGFIGETYIDFADFADSTEPLMLSLPLQASNSGAILHVTVQRMEPNPDASVGANEQPMDDSNRGSSELEVEGYDGDGDRHLISTENKDVGEMVPWYAQENNRGNNPELDPENDTQDTAALGPYFAPQKVAVESTNSDRYEHWRSLTWSSESASEGSIMEIAKGLQDNHKKDAIQNDSSNDNDRLENRIKVLERQVEVSEMEIQSLRKKIVKETKREQELSKQVCSLQEERDAMRTKYEQLKLSPKFIDNAEASNDSPLGTETLRAQLEDVETELQHEQHLNKNLRLRLQKTEDSNSELILAVRDLNERLDQKSKEVSRLSSKLQEKQNATSALDRASKEKSDQNGADDTAELKQKIKELYSDIEAYRKDEEELRGHAESLSLDYEILKKENEDIRSSLEKTQIEKNDIQREYSKSLSTMKQLKIDAERLEEGFKTLELQYSESLEIIREQETQIKILEKELDQQTKDFEGDLEMVTQAKIEQENRAIQAEDALRKTKLDNAHAVERLQEDIRRISVEMTLKIDENVKMATDAAAKADDLRLQNQGLEELLQKTKGELSSMSEHYEQRIVNMRKEMEALSEQSTSMKALLDEKKITEKKFHSEMDQIIAQCDELKHQTIELKSENENLRMQVIKLQTDLQKSKEENMSHKQAEAQNLSNSRRKIKRNMINTGENGKSTEDHKPLKALTTNGKSLEGGKDKGENKNLEETSIGKPAQNGYRTADIRCDESQSWAAAKESDGQANNTMDISKLLNEVEALKERNKQMEGELKDMEERYSDISLKFAEVEGERQQLVMALRNLKNGKKP